MQLNKFTDYALRLLMYIAQPRDTPYTIAEIAQDLHVSQNHLVKIVHFMGKQNWIMTTRGKGGGIRLKSETLNLNLGHIVRILQGNNQIVECHNPPCVFRHHCDLKGILDQALEEFYHALDRYRLIDVLDQKSSSSAALSSPIALINL